MQVILLKDVEKVGLRGDVVEVARGYARNYLLPRQLAEPATAGRLEELRRRDELRARQEARTHDEAREIASRVEQTALRFDVKAGPTGSLFGSVTATDIADKLWTEQRVRVDRRKIQLAEPVKRVGRHDVPVELFTDVQATVRLEVVPEGGDIAQMEQLQAMAEAEQAAAAAEEEAAAAAEAAADEEEAIADSGAPVAEEAMPPADASPSEVAGELVGVAEPDAAVEASAVTDEELAAVDTEPGSSGGREPTDTEREQ